MKKWGGIVFLLGILVLAYLLRDIHFYEIFALLRDINPIYFFLACLCSLLCFLISNFRFMYLLKGLIRVESFFLLVVFFAGSFLNILTPGAGIGGEPAKAYFLSKRYKVSKAKIFGILVADKFFQIFVFGFFILFSVLFILFYINIPGNLRLVLEIILFSVLFLFGFFIFLNLKTFKFNVGAFFKIFHKLWFIKRKFKDARDFEKYINRKKRILFNAFKKIAKKRKNIFYGILLSILFYLFGYLISWFLFLSFGFKINFLFIIIVVTLASLVGEFSPIPGGIGITESSMFLLYSIMGIPFALAVMVALLSRLIHYFFSFVVGGLSLIYVEHFLGKKKEG